nr:hypothetical protein [Acetobacter malorum]
MDYVFMTNFGTILNCSDMGLLYHSYLEEAYPKLLFKYDGRKICCSGKIKEYINIKKNRK